MLPNKNQRVNTASVAEGPENKRKSLKTLPSAENDQVTLPTFEKNGNSKMSAASYRSEIPEKKGDREFGR